MIKRFPMTILFVAAVAAIVSVIAFALLTPSVGLQVRAFKGKDMEPTLHDGDRMLATTNRSRLQRGDIVVFKYPADHSQIFVKRLVGLPGEMLEIKAGRVYVNRQPLEEKYLKLELNRSALDINALKIPEGEYYVMGDNRDSSNDSRLWGTLSADLIVAKVLLVSPL